MKLQVVLKDLKNPCTELDKVLDELSLKFPLEIEKIGLNSPLGKKLAENNNLPTTPGVFLNGKLLALGKITINKLAKSLTEGKNE